jgi:hypothetical protein
VSSVMWELMLKCHCRFFSMSRHRSESRKLLLVQPSRLPFVRYKLRALETRKGLFEITPLNERPVVFSTPIYRTPCVTRLEELIQEHAVQ